MRQLKKMPISQFKPLLGEDEESNNEEYYADEEIRYEYEESESETDDDVNRSDYEENESDDNNLDSDNSDDVPEESVPDHFHSGNYVLLKSDIKWDGDTVISKLDDVLVWKIEGKVLLQKYKPKQLNGKTLHEITVEYTGWRINKRDNYYSITEILDQNPNTDSTVKCVALNLNDLIKVRDK